MIPPKRFDTFPPDWRMLRWSRCVSSDFSFNMSTELCNAKIDDQSNDRNHTAYSYNNNAVHRDLINVFINTYQSPEPVVNL